MAAFLFGAYLAGGRIAREKCRAEYSAAAVDNITKYNEQKRKIDAQVFNTTTVDIRRILRDAYTIAD